MRPRFEDKNWVCPVCGAQVTEEIVVENGGVLPSDVVQALLSRVIKDRQVYARGGRVADDFSRGLWQIAQVSREAFNPMKNALAAVQLYQRRHARTQRALLGVLHTMLRGENAIVACQGPRERVRVNYVTPLVTLLKAYPGVQIKRATPDAVDVLLPNGACGSVRFQLMADLDRMRGMSADVAFTDELDLGDYRQRDMYADLALRTRELNPQVDWPLPEDPVALAVEKVGFARSEVESAECWWEDAYPSAFPRLLLRVRLVDSSWDPEYEFGLWDVYAR
jgi:hypothetical protein